MTRTRLDVPDPAVRRLSLYLRQLESLEQEQVATVSSRRLAESLGLTDAQVRKDLGYFGQFGRPGVGYEVPALVHALRRILGTDRISNALMVGVGNIGRAVAAYHGFRDKGFELVALFDRDERKVGKKVGRLTVQSISDLAAVVREREIRLAIVAVPAAAAQEVADELIAAGIRGILNFAPVQLRVPAHVTVRHIDVAAELEQLVFLTSLR